SKTTNASSTAAAAANTAHVTPESQPLSGASMMANTSSTSPAVNSTAPMGSSFGLRGSRESGMSQKPATKATTTTGTFTRKAALQSKRSSSQPPPIGPIAPPAPATPDQMPMARPRS